MKTQQRTHPCDFSVVQGEKKLRLTGFFDNVTEYFYTPEAEAAGLSVHRFESEFKKGMPVKITIDRPGRQLHMTGYFTTQVEEALNPIVEQLEKGPNPFDLTLRELELLKTLPAADFDYNRVAEMMVISPTTVKTHVNNIFQKSRTHKLESCYVTCLKAGYDI